MSRTLHSIFFVLFFLNFFHGEDVLAGEARPKRLVSTKPNITAIVMALGLAERLVGVTAFCPRPHAGVEIIGNYTAVDIEKIVRLNPGLILGSSENSQRREFESLLNLHLPLHLFEFRTYSEFLTSFRGMAELLAVKARGEDMVAEMGKTLAALKDLTGSKHKTRPTFVVIVQRKPLMVAGPETFISTLLEEAGLTNVFADSHLPYPVLDEEELIRLKANFIFELTEHGESADLTFLSKKLIPLKIGDFLAAPKAVESLDKMLRRLY